MREHDNSRMNFCFVEFEPKDEVALTRLADLLELIKIAKKSQELDEARISGFLSDAERAYFWNPSADELKEWNEDWFSTPVAVRLSPQMPMPHWTLDSMVSALWEGDYDLLGLVERDGRRLVAFDPYGYPYGGTGSLVALVECFGHTVVGVDDGAGYTRYERRVNHWKPKSQRPRKRWLARFLRWKI